MFKLNDIMIKVKYIIFICLNHTRTFISIIEKEKANLTMIDLEWEFKGIILGYSKTNINQIPIKGPKPQVSIHSTPIISLEHT